MVNVPAGHITLRDDRLKKIWTADIVSFSLATTPVTQKLYQDIMDCNPSTFRGDALPVESVSWQEAIQFCNALSLSEGLSPFYSENGTAIYNAANSGYRLPTEAEWQYACQAGTSEIRYGGINQICWYRHNSEGRPHEVGQKTPNAWGLYDMLGNVWEWCTDLYDTEVYGTYRILRGGGWADEPRGCIASNRRRSHPTAFRMDDLGFRVARSF
jgi:formylglycine-generating enzyme required for sulfatase activity